MKSIILEAEPIQAEPTLVAAPHAAYVDPALPSIQRSWRAVALVWLVGVNLRLPVLALPPLLPLVHQDLQLPEAGVAALAGMPLLLFALGGIPGAWLIARFGVYRVLLVGLVTAALAGGVRGVGPSVEMLFAATLCMGAGIAVCQPAVPALVRHWFPSTVARTTSVWSNGLLMGTIVGSALTLPLVLPVAGSWQASLVIWSIPGLLVGALLFAKQPRAVAKQPTAAPLAAPRRRTAWWPEWRSPRVWRLGLLQSAGTLMYFGAGTFIPDFLHANARSGEIAAALAALSVGQLPGSLVLGVLPWAQVMRPRTALALSLTAALALGALLISSGGVFLLAASVLGACAGAMLAVALALPAVLATPNEVPRLSGGVLAIGYATVWLVLVGTGAAWDATRIPGIAFLPAALGAGLILLLMLNRQHAELNK